MLASLMQLHEEISLSQGKGHFLWFGEGEPL